MNRVWTGILALFLFSGAVACTGNVSDDPPEKLIDEDTYINLLIELQLLKSYQESVPPDSTNIDSLKSLIFDRYDVSELRFRLSHNYYQKQVEKQRQRVVRAIDSLRKEIGGKTNAGLDSLKSKMAQ